MENRCYKKWEIEKTFAFSELFSKVKNRKTFAYQKKSKGFLQIDATKSEG